MPENEKPAPTYVLTPSYYPYEQEEEVSLLAYLNVLLKRRWQVLGLTLLTVLSAWFFSLLQAPLYEAGATFLVAEKASPGVVGQGEEGVFLLKDPVAYYKKIATSSPILDRLLEQEYPDPGTGQPRLLLDILEGGRGAGRSAFTGAARPWRSGSSSATTAPSPT